VTGLPSTAIVTGAASGSGRAIAEIMTGHGVHVLGIDMDERGIKTAADELHGLTPIVCDLADLDAVTDLRRIDGLLDADALVNCAGKLDPGYAGGYGADRYQRTIDSMLTAPLILTDLVLPGMYARWERDERPAGIVNIGSFYSLISGAIKGAYTAAKWGLLGFTKTVGIEAARRTGTGVRIVCVCPPHVASPLLLKQNHNEAVLLHKSDEVRSAQLVGQIPTGELATPDDVAGMVWRWLTDPLDRHVTGCALDMGGAITAGFPDEAGW
jgi:3-hydroxybutyrate dehydrogenase